MPNVQDPPASVTRYTLNQRSHHNDEISVSSSSSADDNNLSLTISTRTNTSDYPSSITVRPQPSMQDSLTYESIHSLPFLPRGKTDILPEYSGKHRRTLMNLRTDLEFSFPIRLSIIVNTKRPLLPPTTRSPFIWLGC
jgi:hypothetical protein